MIINIDLSIIIQQEFLTHNTISPIYFTNVFIFDFTLDLDKGDALLRLSCDTTPGMLTTTNIVTNCVIIMALIRKN
jgi:hypothetical protein